LDRKVEQLGRRADPQLLHDPGAMALHRARADAQHPGDLPGRPPLGQELKDATLYALDASTIDLCLSLFPWARFRKTKAAVKLHTLLDLRGSIPSFIHISDGKLHDVNVLDLLLPEPGAFYIMDRAYLDFKRLYSYQFDIKAVHGFDILSAGQKRGFARPYERLRARRAVLARIPI